jgi:hypothetical protein
MGLVDSLPLFMLPALRHCVREIIRIKKEDVLLALKPSKGVHTITPSHRLQEVFQRMVNIDVEYHLLVSNMSTQMDFVERVYTVCFRRPPVIQALESDEAADVADNVDVRGRTSNVSEEECDSGNRVLSRQGQQEGEKKDMSSEDKEEEEEEEENSQEGQHGVASWSTKKQHLSGRHVYKRMRDPSINTETAAQELVQMQKPRTNKKAMVGEGPFPSVPPTLRFSLDAKNILFAFGHNATDKMDIQHLSNMVMTTIRMQQPADSITPGDVEALLGALSPAGGVFCFEQSNDEKNAEKFMGIVHLTRIRDMIVARYQLAQVRMKKEELIKAFKETQKEEALLGQDW